MSPDELRAALTRAFAAQSSGDAARAAAAFEQILAAQPEQPHALLLYGRMQRQRGDFRAAANLLQRAYRAAPQSADVIAELGYLALAQNNNRAATAAFLRLTQIQPKLADAHYNLAQAHKGAGELDAAIVSYRQALALGIASPEDVHTDLGFALALNQQPDAAAECFSAALKLAPDYARAHYGQGVVAATRGDFESALNSYRRALAIDPELVEAFEQLASVKRFAGLSDPDLALLEKLVQEPQRSAYAREKLHFALGKACDDCEAWTQAGTHYEQANQLKSARVAPFDPAAFAAQMIRIATAFGAEGWPEPLPAPAADVPQPIFIVGMPRSGTTLVEQILSAHSLVGAAGEQGFFDRQTQGALQPWPNKIATLEPEQLLAIRGEYQALLGTFAAGAAMVTDKYPANFQHLGLIRWLFPDAPIIHCRRDPRDTGLSIWFQDFKAGNYYAYDRSHIAAVYRSYEQLMAHWNSVLPRPPLTMHYESLVSDLEGETRRMLDECRLGFEPACLAFSSNQRPVETLSRWQVRQPLYTRSVGRWRHYEPFLGPLASLVTTDRDDRGEEQPA